MRAPVSWLRELVAIPADQSGRDIAERLIAAGLEVETVETVGGDVDGTLRVGRVLDVEELTEFKKPIRWCQVDVGDGEPRGIVCGARNFAAGDLTVVALPGVVLPGGFVISARSTYGKVSDGMMCSERELGLSDSHEGIIVLPAGSGAPGDDASGLLGLGDEILDIAVTPDRGYALSIRGIAREVAISYGVDFVDPGLSLVDLPAPAADRAPADCASDDLAACDLFTLRTIVGIDPTAPSPRWMQQRLLACGMRPLSLAVDVTNYVMLELGQPLHAFDLDKLRGPVRASRVADGTAFTTLDHVDRILSDDDLVIADDRGPIGLAGVMGGLDTEVDDATTSIALEAAHFAAPVITRIGRRHRLSSEASRRFERGVDRDLAPYASARAAALLLEHGGGTYVGMTAVEAPRVVPVIGLPAAEPGAVAGTPIDTAEVVQHLTAIGCDVRLVGERLDVIPPSWRPDLVDPIDLVEEVLRLHGYERLPSTLPMARLGRGLTPTQRMRRRAGTALAARGLVEVLTYPFVGAEELDALRLPADDPRRVSPRLANPLSDEQPHLRASLLPGLLATARRNVGRGTTDLAIFEIGAVYRGEVADDASVRPPVSRRPTDEEWEALAGLLPHQPLHLAACWCGSADAPGWWGSARPADWADAVDAARIVADSCGVSLEVVRGADDAFHPGRCAELRLDGIVVGAAGELHPAVAAAYGLPERTCALDLDLDAVMTAAPLVRTAPDIISQPVAKEDLAFIVDHAVSAADLRAAIASGAGPLLESVRLFDVYSGPPVPAGSRSMAFALRFRAPDRTLDATEIAAARDGAVAAAAEQCGAVLRA